MSGSNLPFTSVVPVPEPVASAASVPAAPAPWPPVAPESLKLKVPLTYLGTLFKEEINANLPYENGQWKSLPENALKRMGQYEAVLSQAAYFSRLMYDPNEVIAKTAQFVHYNPVVFNTALSLIRYDYSRITSPTASQTVIVPNPIHPENKDGLILNSVGTMDDTPCYLQLLDYTGKINVPFPGKKVLYIAFRGTVTIGSALADANVASLSIDEILKTCSIGGKSGSQVFNKEIAETSSGKYLGKVRINPFGAHQGFVRQMKHIMDKVCVALNDKFLALKPDKIIVTGHSLGAANATLASLVLAGFKRAGLILPELHCITFGGPKLLTDYSRNVYNSFLQSGVLTLDRVANRASAAKTAGWTALSGGVLLGSTVDLVTLIPPNFDHPGFMILKTEIKTQTWTGRSKNISDLRQMFAGVKPPSSLSFSGTYNGIATYKEYLDCFQPLINDKFAEIINKTGTLGAWGPAYKAEYALIKTQVDKVLGKSTQDVAVDPTKQLGDLAPDPTVIKAAAAAEAAAKAEEAAGAGAGAAKNQNGGGEYTDNYKENTMKYGPNHIVYSPQMTVSLSSAHLTYCGVGWNGIFKNIGHIRELRQEIQYGNTLIGVGGGKRARRIKKTRKARKAQKAQKARKTRGRKN